MTHCIAEHDFCVSGSVVSLLCSYFLKINKRAATLPFRNGWLSRFYFSWVDPTRIIQGPVDTEIIVGESIVLPCQVTSDPVLDVSFSWAFNGQLIAKGDGHFEFVGGVSDPQP